MPRREELKPRLKALHWLPVSDGIKYKLSCMGLYPVTVSTAQCLAERLQTRAHQHLPDSLQQTLGVLRPVNQYGYIALRPVNQYGYIALRPANQYRSISPCSRHLTHYAQSTSMVISVPAADTWCFTPSQPVRLYRFTPSQPVQLYQSLQQTLDALRSVNQYGYITLRPVNQYGYISPCSRPLTLYARSTSMVISVPAADTWCFTPSQPVRLYQSLQQTFDALRPVNQYGYISPCSRHLVFYAQSTSTVISLYAQSTSTVISVPAADISRFTPGQPVWLYQFLQQTLGVLRPVNQYGYIALRPVNQYGYNSSCSRHLTLYPQSTSMIISVPAADTWCFTPSQPVRLYQSLQQTLGVLRPVNQYSYIRPRHAHSEDPDGQKEISRPQLVLPSRPCSWEQSLLVCSPLWN